MIQALNGKLEECERRKEHLRRSWNGEDIVLTSNGTQSRSQFPAADRYLEYLLGRLPEGARMWYVFPVNLPEVASRCLDILGLREMKADHDRVCR